jgi:hypothetical protein
MVPEFTFDDTDPTKPTLWRSGPTNLPSDTDPMIPCKLNNASTLTLDGTGFSMWHSRGLYSLNVTPATITAAFSNLPPTVQPGQTITGAKLTCSNAGIGLPPPPKGPDANNANCVPTVASGGGTISNIVCTHVPVAPNPVLTVPVTPLQDGESIVCTFNLTLPSTPTINVELEGDATATGLSASTNAGMTARVWLRTPSNAAVPTLGEWTLALLALAVLGVAGLDYKRRA